MVEKLRHAAGAVQGQAVWPNSTAGKVLSRLRSIVQTALQPPYIICCNDQLTRCLAWGSHMQSPPQ